MAKMVMALSKQFCKRIAANYLSYSSFSGDQNYFPQQDKDVSLQAVKTPDILMSKIKNSSGLTELLSVVGTHGQIFNQKHTIQTFKSIFDVTKNDKGKNLSINVVGNPTFERLCGILKKHSRFLDLNEIVEAIKILSFVGVTSNSTIFQVLLQLVRQNINNLNVNQIIFLDYIFIQSENNHLIDSLKLAMPLVFQINLPLEIDKEDVPHLTKLLGYATQNNIHDRYISNIVTCLVLRNQSIQLDSAKNILWCMCRLNLNHDIPQPAHRKLIRCCFNVFLKNITELNVDDVCRTLSVIKKRVITNGTVFYNEKFFDACADYAIIKGLNFDKALSIARDLCRLAHTNFQLLDYLTEKALIENIEKFRPNFVFSYINCLSNADYKPQNWRLVEERLYENTIFRNERIDLPWSRLAIQLATLDSYNDDLLNKMFNEDFISQYLCRDNNTLDNIQMLQLYQAVNSFYPSYSGTLPSLEILSTAIEISGSKFIDPSMKAEIEEGLGGPEFVGTAVQLSLGIFVDFVVQFQDGKTPIAISPNANLDKTIKIEDLNIQNNIDIVCILNFHKGCYSINCKRLRGNSNLALKTLEKQGYKVIAISGIDWANMESTERIPYLINEIQYKYTEKNNIISV